MYQSTTQTRIRLVTDFFYYQHIKFIKTALKIKNIAEHSSVCADTCSFVTEFTFFKLIQPNSSKEKSNIMGSVHKHLCL